MKYFQPFSLAFIFSPIPSIRMGVDKKRRDFSGKKKRNKVSHRLIQILQPKNIFFELMPEKLI